MKTGNPEHQGWLGEENGSGSLGEQGQRKPGPLQNTELRTGQGRWGLEPGVPLPLLLGWRKLPHPVCVLAFPAGHTAPSDPTAI